MHTYIQVSYGLEECADNAKVGFSAEFCFATQIPFYREINCLFREINCLFSENNCLFRENLCSVKLSYFLNPAKRYDTK
jgi:hypothetical protein